MNKRYAIKISLPMLPSNWRAPDLEEAAVKFEDDLAAAGYAVVEVKRAEALATKLRRNFENSAAAELEDMIAAAQDTD